MSIFDDFFDFVGDTVEDIGDTLEDTWQAIKSNPIGAITSAVAMAYGIPPMWAGALGGGAGAAATGGNIVKGAFTGGAMGYMGSMAGAATGSLGPIAQAAAMGATSAATGAVLTGQDVMTAVKAGLILGTVSGGVAKLMTPAEAIAAVPKETLTDIYSKGQDPLGDLIKQQGWTDSDSARAAASQAFSKNAATTIQQLQQAVPDYVLKEAQAIQKTGNPQAYINEQMGWADNGVTNSAATKALDAYSAANKVVNRYGPKNELAPVSDAVSKTPAQIQSEGILNTGLVDATDAQVLAGGGYTASDVKSLIDAGYSASDLADMAATGVPASTLKSLANTQFTESQINNLLTTGHVSANEIAQASNLVNAGKVSVTTADSLMKAGVNSLDLPGIVNSGKADQFAKLMENGVSKSNAQYLLDKNVDLAKVNDLVSNGKLTGQQLNDSVSNNTYNKVISNASVGPVAPTETTSTAGTTTPSSVNPNNIPTSNLPKLDDMWAKYDKIDSFNPAQPDTAKILSNSDTFADNLLKEQYGTSANTGVINNAGNPNSAYYKNLEAAVASGNPEQFLASKGYNQATVDQLMDYYDAKTYAQSQYQGQQVASGYTAAQEAQYNELIKQGMSPADAVNKIATTPQAPTAVEVSGGAGFAENPSSVIPEYRTPNTDLATQADIDSGAAKYNAGANAWEVPRVVAPEQPIVPVTPPVTPPAPVPEIPTVEVTAPRVETPQPVVPIIPPVVTPPTTVAPTQPVVQPPAPVAPPAPVTTVSSSTRTTSDGSVYRDEQKSDGSFVTTLISGPTGTGTGGTGGTTTEIPEITVTAPKEPPLTPPTQVVIPPDSSYVAPVEVTPPPAPETPVTPTEPTTPTDPTLPIVPIVPPVTPIPTTETLHGRAYMGPIPDVTIPNGLNPGFITDVPTYYKTNNPAQAQYYWGAHPYQPGPKFNPTLYNQIPNAPVKPFGSTYAQTSATPAQILAAMQNQYPLLNTVSASGPVRP